MVLWAVLILFSKLYIMKPSEKKTLTNFIDKSISKLNPVHGITTVYHRVRHEFKITMEEYCVVALIEELTLRNKELIYERFMSYIGMEDTKQIDQIIIRMVSCGLLEMKEGTPMVTKKWTNSHNKDRNEQFEIFWHSSQGRSWPGSKPLALQRYIETASIHGDAFLLEQKKAYFDYLNCPGNEYRATMQASDWLNIKMERFKEDWRMQTLELLKRQGKPLPEPIESLKPSISVSDKKRMFMEE